MGKQEEYLDNIVEHLVNETKYDTDHHNVYIIKFPFSDTWEVFGSHGVMSSIYDIYPERFDTKRWDFDQEMINTFGLIEHESDYVWEKYFEGARFFGKEYAKSDGLINESVDKQKEYIDKVIERLISKTKVVIEPSEIYDGYIIAPLGNGFRWDFYNKSLQPHGDFTNELFLEMVEVYGFNTNEVFLVGGIYKDFIWETLEKISNGRY
jgi:hypothetical protein